MVEPISTPMIKFGLKIRTRAGLAVDNLTVHARDQADAERRIRQMYPQCEVLECRQFQAAIRDDVLNLENIISLISRQPDDDKGSGK
jgi:hypothetical protein